MKFDLSNNPRFDASIARRLRDEGRLHRAAFSPSLHARLCAALVQRAPGFRRARRRHWRPLVAAASVLVALIAWQLATQPWDYSRQSGRVGGGDVAESAATLPAIPFGIAAFMHSGDVLANEWPGSFRWFSFENTMETVVEDARGAADAIFSRVLPDLPDIPENTANGISGDQAVL